MSAAKPVTGASLLIFPCAFPLKVLGRSVDGFAQAVLEIVLRHVPTFAPESMTLRSSRNNGYLSLTCTVQVSAQFQLDSLYRELSSHPMVSMVL